MTLTIRGGGGTWFPQRKPNRGNTSNFAFFAIFPSIPDAIKRRNRITIYKSPRFAKAATVFVATIMAPVIVTPIPDGNSPSRIIIGPIITNAIPTQTKNTSDTSQNVTIVDTSNRS
jgi:hypothetical protein